MKSAASCFFCQLMSRQLNPWPIEAPPFDRDLESTDGKTSIRAPARVARYNTGFQSSEGEIKSAGVGSR